jgi:hypothetical protein
MLGVPGFPALPARSAVLFEWPRLVAAQGTGSYPAQQGLGVAQPGGPAWEEGAHSAPGRLV